VPSRSKSESMNIVSVNQLIDTPLKWTGKGNVPLDCLLSCFAVALPFPFSLLVAARVFSGGVLFEAVEFPYLRL
jgi:hypothetical protein